MKRLIPFLFIVTILAACGKKTSTEESTATTAPAQADNTLTEQQKADGWKLLFDGQTTNGWRFYKGKENDTWEVVDGTLHCKLPDSTASKRADLMTVDKYKNFELSFDWKISEKQNSGVMFRVTEEFEVPYATGPEFQLIDDANYPGGVKPVNQTGANYDVHATENLKLNPVGQWNNSRIVVNGTHVEHWMNGGKIVEYEINSEDWKKRVAASKWKEFPKYGQAEEGHIDLQDHGGEVWFKNIMIKTL
jgi:hypothetical protein